MCFLYYYVHRLYLGPTPIVVVADPDMLKEIMVKHFDSFTDRVVCATNMHLVHITYS